MTVCELAFTTLTVSFADWTGLPAQSAQVFLMGFLRRDYGAAGLFQLAHQGALSGVQAVVLGGSRARGAATPESDLDLGIYRIVARHGFMEYVDVPDGAWLGNSGLECARG